MPPVYSKPQEAPKITTLPDKTLNLFDIVTNVVTTVAHKGQCDKKWFAANKKDRMQTKKIGCKQKTKTCHDASSSLDQLTPSLATSYKLQIMILKS